MKRSIYHLLTAGCVMLATACATRAPNFQPVTQLPAGQFLVYFYAQPDGLGAVPIFQAQTRLVTLHPGEYCSHFAEPGRITFRIPKPFDLSDGLTGGLVKDRPEDAVSFVAQAGQTYFFRVHGRTLMRVDQATGAAEITSCRFASEGSK